MEKMFALCTVCFGAVLIFWGGMYAIAFVIEMVSMFIDFIKSLFS